ncbi:SAM-dependent methyltransferase [Parvibaculum indicum]|uniref:class I SAM-dependent methyltransferase n=1 Tax=Parvibaculum indicum TaxID=562969 RepID=UPI001421D655|nr:methyltransferase domain-containing protein [Parvibaculum indicum]NIJ41418.1 SAM-dependent methyltransferase [Parvibaculum indicum]
MHMDVIDLRDFYGRPLGAVARTLITRRIGEIWPDVRGLNVAGLGFATPYLSPFQGQAQRVIGLMPAQQGVLAWPPNGKYLTCLVDETEIPLPDESMDRILLVHGLEGSEAVRSMMRQIWRVLAPGGRLLVVAPNRRGLWSRREGTPFGIGQPFSRSQLTQLMRENMFSPTRWETALYVPPVQWRPFLQSAGVWEQVGHTLWTRFSGVIMVEAGKQIYAATPQPKRRLARRMRALSPAPVPQGMQSRSRGDEE